MVATNEYAAGTNESFKKMVAFSLEELQLTDLGIDNGLKYCLPQRSSISGGFFITIVDPDSMRSLIRK
jgi:hypothetical protein